MILKITALTLLGCSPMVKPEADGEAKRAVLDALLTRVVEPTLASFETETAALETAAVAWRDARRTGPATAERTAAQVAFRAAFLRWERAEMLAFGPAGKQPTFPLGQGLRDQLYSWPTTNPCRVDTVLAERSYAAAGYFDTALVTTTGLDAIEQLLYVDGTANACPATASINTAGTWAGLSTDELGQRRSEYAALAAGALLQQAKRLRAAWAEVRGQYVDAGLAGSSFTTAQAALNDVFSAMFQADLALKNARIGVPAGLVAGACPTAVCPELAEARPSGLSREAIVANLDGLRALLRGDFDAGGTGFDSLLEARGAGSLATEMDAAILVARGRAEALSAPIAEAVTSDLGAVQQLHADVKAFTDLIKLQFITVLTLQVPAEGAGDAD